MIKSLIKNFPIIAIIGIFPLTFICVLWWAISTANRLVPHHPFYGPDQTAIDNAPKHIFQQPSHFSLYPQLQAD
ncbi:MAG TPA: hypothetical protein VK970_00680, partial [Candidatus Methylacidiphilales bacterium]|nr:hypothetical protein [Candidatus Methylacidiphilales bacterium]